MRRLSYGGESVLICTAPLRCYISLHNFQRTLTAFVCSVCISSGSTLSQPGAVRFFIACTTCLTLVEHDFWFIFIIHLNGWQYVAGIFCYIFVIQLTAIRLLSIENSLSIQDDCAVFILDFSNPWSEVSTSGIISDLRKICPRYTCSIIYVATSTGAVWQTLIQFHLLSYWSVRVNYVLQHLTAARYYIFKLGYPDERDFQKLLANA